MQTMASRTKKPQTEERAINQELVHNLKKIVAPLSRNKGDIDDIIQEILLKVHRKGSAVEPGKFLAWLYQVSRTTAIDFYRKNKLHGVYEDEQHSQALEPDASDKSTAMNALSSCIRPLLKSLKDDEQRILADADLNGISQIDIAGSEGLKYSALKSKVQRARKKLKDEILECCRVELDSRKSPIEVIAKKKSSCC